LRTIVYVDALNLYYRALKERPNLKWLNLEILFDNLLPKNEVIGINYYYAPVKGKVDRDAPNRQNAYIRALKTCRRIRLIKGRFLSTKTWAGVAHDKRFVTLPPPDNPIFPIPEVARVWRHEEKGSDVNLGVELVRDAFLGAFEVAAVVTNDTDLVRAFEIVREDTGKDVGLVCPTDRAAPALQAAASFVRHLAVSDLRKAQFPDHLEGGRIRRPVSWNQPN